MQLLLLACLLALGACRQENQTSQTYTPKSSQNSSKTSSKLQNGDVIFQISLSGQGKAIQLATHSEYTHCGIVFERSGQYFVAEAIQPVTVTLLQDWIARGDKGHFVVKRLKDRQVLSPAVLQRMWLIGKTFLGKPYDLYFGWGDDKIYCSELVWKIYKQGANIELARLQRIQDFDLTSQEVKQKMLERYGANIPHMEKAISPAQLFESDLLETVPNPSVF